MTSNDPPQHPVDPELATALRLVTTRLARRIRQNVDRPLTPSRLSALTTIARRGPLTLGRLAELEHVGRASITRMAASLEQEALIGRTSGVDDRRCVIVHVTPAGEELLAAMRARVDAYITRQVGHLTPAERDVLEQAMPVLERLLESEA